MYKVLAAIISSIKVPGSGMLADSALPKPPATPL
jgi:hypothetical protein